MEDSLAKFCIEKSKSLPETLINEENVDVRKKDKCCAFGSNDLAIDSST